jgi:hypothetical protein
MRNVRISKYLLTKYETKFIPLGSASARLKSSGV